MEHKNECFKDTEKDYQKLLRLKSQLGATEFKTQYKSEVMDHINYLASKTLEYKDMNHEENPMDYMNHKFISQLDLWKTRYWNLI